MQRSKLCLFSCIWKERAKTKKKTKYHSLRIKMFISQDSWQLQHQEKKKTTKKNQIWGHKPNILKKRETWFFGIPEISWGQVLWGRCLNFYKQFFIFFFFFWSVTMYIRVSTKFNFLFTKRTLIDYIMSRKCLRKYFSDHHCLYMCKLRHLTHPTLRQAFCCPTLASTVLCKII